MIGISKHGNTYLRKLLIHGARTVLHLVKDRSTPLARWVDGLKARMHANGLCCTNRLTAGLPLIPDRPILRPS